MQVKTREFLDRRYQNSKKLTPPTYTKGNMGRRETTWGKENERQPPRNQRLNLRPKTTFQPHIVYTNENIIQTSNDKHGERENHQRCDAVTRWENKEGKRDKTKSANFGAVLELWKIAYTPKTRSWKPRRTLTIDGKLTTRKTTSKTTKLWPNQGDAVPNISRNLRKKRSSQYCLEHPKILWKSTAQLKTHKPDLQ